MNRNLLEKIVDSALSDEVMRALYHAQRETAPSAQAREALAAVLVPALVEGTLYWAFGREDIWRSKHSRAPFRARHTSDGQTEIDAGEGGWGAFAVFITKMSDGTVSEEGLANVRLFVASPAMVQFLEVYVQENGKRGGRYDQLLPAEQQTAMVKRAMSIIAEVDGEAI